MGRRGIATKGQMVATRAIMIQECCGLIPYQWHGPSLQFGVETVKSTAIHPPGTGLAGKLTRTTMLRSHITEICLLETVSVSERFVAPQDVENDSRQVWR